MGPPLSFPASPRLEKRAVGKEREAPFRFPTHQGHTRATLTQGPRRERRGCRNRPTLGTCLGSTLPKTLPLPFRGTCARRRARRPERCIFAGKARERSHRTRPAFRFLPFLSLKASPKAMPGCRGPCPLPGRRGGAPSGGRVPSAGLGAPSVASLRGRQGNAPHRTRPAFRFAPYALRHPPKRQCLRLSLPGGYGKFVM